MRTFFFKPISAIGLDKIWVPKFAMFGRKVRERALKVCGQAEEPYKSRSMIGNRKYFTKFVEFAAAAPL